MIPCWFEFENSVSFEKQVGLAEIVLFFAGSFCIGR